MREGGWWYRSAPGLCGHAARATTACAPTVCRARGRLTRTVLPPASNLKTLLAGEHDVGAAGGVGEGRGGVPLINVEEGLDAGVELLEPLLVAVVDRQGPAAADRLQEDVRVVGGLVRLQVARVPLDGEAGGHRAAELRAEEHFRLGP